MLTIQEEIYLNFQLFQHFSATFGNEFYLISIISHKLKLFGCGKLTLIYFGKVKKLRKLVICLHFWEIFFKSEFVSVFSIVLVITSSTNSISHIIL